MVGMARKTGNKGEWDGCGVAVQRGGGGVEVGGVEGRGVPRKTVRVKQSGRLLSTFQAVPPQRGTRVQQSARLLNKGRATC